MTMRDFRHLRALAALIAGFSCLAMPVLVSGALTALGPADSHHGEVAGPAIAQLQPAESGHDTCWVAEVDEHQRHDDHRFEPQRGLHHHLHAAVAWSSTASVESPAQALHADLPRLDDDALLDQPHALRALERSPRQSRAPPRA